MRFLTITCNAAVDTTYLLDRLALGEVNRVERVIPAPGGKGNNVARVLATLGQTAIATGFAGGCHGAFIEDGLRAAGVEPAFVPVDGESRLCLTIVETAEERRTTEIREPGTPLGREDAARLLARVRELAAGVDVAVVSGSLPPGLEASFVAELIATLAGTGVFVALDASGEALRHGLRAGPHLIKPNLDELTELVGHGSPDELIELARDEVIGPLLGPEGVVLCSMGAAGAALVRVDGGWRATPPAIEVANSVGSGDALLAGFLDARARGEPDAAALAHAVAVGTAAALQAEVGAVDLQDVRRLRPLVRTTELPAAVATSPRRRPVGTEGDRYR